MKKLVAISLFIFAVVLTAILTAGLLSYEKNKTVTSNLSNNQINSAVSTTGQKQTNLVSVPKQKLVLNLAEISRHNTVNDCWMIISNSIYNVTSYVYQHPGGANEIIKFCGQDATVAFQTKDNRGRDHSGQAYSMLTPYYLGDLNQIIVQ